jgi:hypothetical protein
MKRPTVSLPIVGTRLPSPEVVLRLTPKVRRFILLASAATGCLVSVSCQTSGVPEPQVPTARYQPGHWKRVTTNPPTYYPQGVDSDSPTAWANGEWYRVCDAADSRYFVPFKLPDGRDRQTLVSEVQSLRTADYRRQMAKEDSETTKESVDGLKKFAKYSPVLVPLNTALVLVAAIAGAGGGGISFVSAKDFERWLHEDDKKTMNSGHQ